MTQFPEQSNDCMPVPKTSRSGGAMPENDFPMDSHAMLSEIDVEIDPDLILDFLDWLIDLIGDYGYCDQ